MNHPADEPLAEVECGCVPGHRMLVTTSACYDCGLTEVDVEEGNNRPCEPNPGVND